MIAIIVSWVTISFSLISFGNIATSVYQRVCRQDETYSLADTFILGLVPISILVGFWSIWMPSNELLLFIFIAIGILYWCINYRQVKLKWRILKNTFKTLPPIAYLCIGVLVVMFLISSTWLEGIYDSLFYHHQQIKWNELYAVVPGLGNLDDRFAFNSNYLLISALFSFRFLWGEAIYSLIPLTFLIVGSWIIKEVFFSRFGFKSVIIFIAYAAFTVHSIYFIFDTSTDLLPNLICFYIVARIVLDPNFISRNILFCFTIPLFLITCKLSVVPFCILTLYCIYTLAKNKQYASLIFMCAISVGVIIPWLIRNVIISGYLIYPITFTNLFSFDWQIPSMIAQQQRAYITSVGQEFFEIVVFTPTSKFRDPVWNNLLTATSYALIGILCPILFVKIIKRKSRLHKSIQLLLAITTISIILWIVSGPDARFISGILFAFIALLFIQIFDSKKKQHFVKIGTISLLFFSITVSAWSLHRTHNAYKAVTTSLATDVKPFVHIFITPYTEKDKQKISNFNVENNLKAYKLNNNCTIYIGDLINTLEVLPSTVDNNRPGKYMNYRDLEARGKSYQDGFRVKADSLYKYK